MLAHGYIGWKGSLAADAGAPLLGESHQTAHLGRGDLLDAGVVPLFAKSLKKENVKICKQLFGGDFFAFYLGFT